MLCTPETATRTPVYNSCCPAPGAARQAWFSLKPVLGRRPGFNPALLKHPAAPEPSQALAGQALAGTGRSGTRGPGQTLVSLQGIMVFPGKDPAFLGKDCHGTIYSRALLPP